MPVKNEKYDVRGGGGGGGGDGEGMRKDSWQN